MCKRGVNTKSGACDDLLWTNLAKHGEGRHLAAMDMPVTLSIGGAFLALAVFAGWRGARPPDLARGVRMIPWRGIMLFSAAGVLLMLVHVVNMLGFQTGR